MPEAPRLLLRQWERPGRGVLAGMLLLASVAGAYSEPVRQAEFAEPTTRYGHGVLGDKVEYGALRITTPSGNTRLFRLAEDHVFEDLSPRLADVDGDGDLEVVVVETDVTRGAALAIYDARGKVAETPHIGRSHRWLAPLGVADLDADGQPEILYVDRPHLARTLRVWHFTQGQLREVASAPGHTNHRIGDAFIQGGVKTCGVKTAILTADRNWEHILITEFDGTTLSSAQLAPYLGPDSFARALNCDEN